MLAAVVLLVGLVGGVNAAPLVAGTKVYVSATVGGTVGSVVYDDEDILEIDVATGAVSVYFDGSGVLPADADVNGFQLNDDGTIDMTFQTPITIGGLGSVDDSDVVTFDPTGLGEGSTAGTFSFLLDGSTAELSTADEDVVAVATAPTGELLFSTQGNLRTTSLNAPNDDLIQVNEVDGVIGYSTFLDGSDVGLVGENLSAASVDAATGDVYGADLQGFNVPGLAGDGGDIFVLTGGTRGGATSGTYSLAFDTQTVGLEIGIDGLHVDLDPVDPPVNTDPVAVDDAVSFGEDDGAGVVDVLVNDTDADLGDVLAVTALDDVGTVGAVSLIDGLVSYDPNGQFEALNAGETATDSFGYTISDGNGGSASAVVTVTIDGADDPVDPPADSDVLYLSLATGGSVGGVAFADEDILEFEVATGTWSMFFDGSDVLPGSAEVDGFRINANGSIDLTFQAASTTVAGLGGVDDADVVRFVPTSTGDNTAGSFTATLFDGSAEGLASGTEDITAVTTSGDGDLVFSTIGSLAVPGLSAPDEDLVEFDGTTFSRFFDGSDVALPQEDVAGAFFDRDADELYLAAQTAFATPSLAGDGDDVFIHTGARGENTNGSFALYFDGDAEGLDNQIDGLHVVIGGGQPSPNVAPVAADDEVSVGEDDGATQVEVLVNDTDADGDPLSVVSVDDTVSLGLVSLVDGVVSYDPNGAFEVLRTGETGTDSFTYVIDDGRGGLDSATVTVTIEGADEVTDSTDVLYLSLTAGGTVGGVTFADEDILSYAVASDTWALFFDGSDVLPGSADVDAFRLNPDGSMEFSFQAASTTVAGLGAVDDADVVRFVPTSTGEQTAGTFTEIVFDGSAEGLANGTEDLTAITTSGEGNLVFSTLGALAVPGLSGPDEDLYEFDGTGFTRFFDGSDVALPQEDLWGASYDPVADELYLAVLNSVNTPSFNGDGDDVFIHAGNRGNNTDGTFTLYFDGDANGLDGQIDALAVTTFEANQAPVAVDDVLTVGEDAGATPVGVLTNDFDPDANALAVDSVDTSGTVGTVDLVGGVVVYDPAGQFEALNPGETATDTFRYTIVDGEGGSATATVVVTIEGADEANQPPTAVDDEVSVGENGLPVAINVLGNDSDLDGGTLTAVSVDTTATLGRVTFFPGPGAITYSTDGQFEGLGAGETATDTFTYVVSDGQGGTATATVTITVTGENDAPTAVDDTLALSEDDGARGFNVLGNDVDADGDLLSLDSLDTVGVVGLVNFFNDGTVIYSPDGRFESLAVGEATTEVFTYVVSDGIVADTGVISVTVSGANDAPVAVEDSATFGEDDGAATIDVLVNDSDIDNGDTLSVTSVDDSGTLGTVTLVGGVVSYDPNAQFESLNTGDTATDTFTYTVSDSDGAVTTAVVTVTIDGADEPRVDTLIYLAGEGSDTVDGISFQPNDIMVYNQDTDTWAFFFDGSDVVPAAAGGIDALQVNEDGTIDLSFRVAADFPGLGLIDESDIVTFEPVELGPVTAGSFSLKLNGSDRGLVSSAEDIVGYSTDALGRDTVSLEAFSFIPNSAGVETIVVSSNSILTPDGAGWLELIDFGNRGLFTVEAHSFAGEDLYFQTNIGFVTGVRNDENDVLRYSGAIELPASGSITKFFDGSDQGYDTNIAGLHVALPAN